MPGTIRAWPPEDSGLSGPCTDQDSRHECLDEPWPCGGPPPPGTGRSCTSKIQGLCPPRRGKGLQMREGMDSPWGALSTQTVPVSSSHTREHVGPA